MFIDAVRTPNPHAMKFLPGARLTCEHATTFVRESFETAASPLAARLFALDGVAAVYVAPAFITVTRAPGAPSWTELKAPVLLAIADHVDSGEDAVRPDSSETSDPVAPDAGVVAEIKAVLKSWVQPGVARDGGDILFERFDATSGVLWIRMIGACGGCPSSRLTLKAGVERIVRRYVPEVLSVEETGQAAPQPVAERLRGWLGRAARAGGAPKRPVFTHHGREIAKGPTQGPGGLPE